jgi:hypothetical protein
MPRNVAGLIRHAIVAPGHRIGTRDGTLAVDYAQKGFTKKQLDAFLESPTTS